MKWWQIFTGAIVAALKKKSLLFGISASTQRTGYVNPVVSDFLAKIRPAALAVESQTGIPWTFAATQAGHESAFGQSKLTLANNNLFGYTATQSWIYEGKPTAKYLTRECSDKPPETIRYWEFPNDIFSKTLRPDGGTDLQVWRYFRTYPDWSASLDDWAGLIERRYPQALLCAKAGDFAGFAKALEAGGYATDKDPKTGELVYAKKLIDLHGEISGLA